MIKILCLRLRRIGDIVLTTPALMALKTAWPESEVHYLVEKPYAQLIEHHPGVDQAIIVPPKPSILEFMSLLRRLRREKYDFIIDFHGGPRAFSIVLFTPAQQKIGYRLPGKHWFYDFSIPRGSEAQPIHSAENHLNLIRALGREVISLPPLTLPEPLPAEKEKVHHLLAQHSLHAKNFLVLHVGAGNEFRHWGQDNLSLFLQLQNQQKPSFPLCLVGGPEDKPSAQLLMDQLKSQPSVSVLNLVNAFSLRELYYFFQQALLFIGPDSGPMHLAAAAGLPLVVYFGPTLPAHFGPWQAKATILERPYNCRPCRQRHCTLDNFPCLRTISPQEVWQAVNQMVEEISVSVDSSDQDKENRG